MQIKCKNLDFSYDKHQIIKKMSLEIEPGQLTVIAGPNGIGKSTVIKCLCNIYKPDHGVVYLDGSEISSISAHELAKKLGYVPQKQVSIFDMTAYELVLLGRRPYINWKVTAKDEVIVESILKRLNIISLAEREVNTLSGGERQKIAIARALAQEPEMLFFDEPTSSLDINHQMEVMEILKELVNVDQCTVVVVLHDLNLANIFADQVYLLGKEGIYAAGEPSQVFTPDNIKQVYGIDVEIIKGQFSNYILPIRAKKVLHNINQEHMARRNIL